MDAILIGTWPAAKSINIAAIFIEPVDLSIQPILQTWELAVKLRVVICCSFAFVLFCSVMVWFVLRYGAIIDDDQIRINQGDKNGKRY